MIPVSTEWHNAIKQQFRYPAYFRMTIEVVPPGLREGLDVSSTYTDSRSANPDVLAMRLGSPTPYATLEQNRWQLNGRYSILESDGTSDDWWSEEVSSGNTNIDFVFDQTYDTPGIYFEWDVANGTYPTNVSIRGYDALGTLLQEYIITSIDSATGFVEAPFENVKRVLITFNSWNKTGWRARINQIVFGTYASYDSINNGRVQGVDTNDVSSPFCDELPKHTLSVRLRNQDQEFDPSLNSGISKYVATRQKVQVEWGFTVAPNNVEWSPVLTYYIKDFSVPSDSKEVKIDTTSRLAMLTQNYRVDDYTGSSRTLHSIAQRILQNSGIIKSYASEEPWVLSNTLKQFTTSAPVPIMSANALLQLIAGAATMWLGTDATTGYVKIDDMRRGASTTELTQMVQLGDPEIKIQDLLYKINVGIYKYNRESTQSEITKGEYLVTGRATLQIEYGDEAALDVTCSVSGATLVSFTPYGMSATVVLQSQGTSSVATIVLTGYRVKKSVAYVQTYIDNTITHGLEVTIDNVFVTEAETAAAITDWFVAWYNRRQMYKIPYLGIPELVPGDTVSLVTNYGTESSIQVLGNKISFNGGFSGTLEVR